MEGVSFYDVLFVLSKHIFSGHHFHETHREPHCLMAEKPAVTEPGRYGMTLHPRMGDPWTARLMERQLQHLAEQEDEPPELLVGSLRRHQSVTRFSLLTPLRSFPPSFLPPRSSGFFEGRAGQGDTSNTRNSTRTIKSYQGSRALYQIPTYF